MSASLATGGTEYRRALRDSQQPIIGGVASGLARHLGLPVLWVRVGFVVSAAIGGLGIALYAGLWLVLPSDTRFDQSAPGLESATRTGKRPGRVRRLTDLGPIIALGVRSASACCFLLSAALGSGTLLWPAALGVAGIALLWRQADEAQRERWVDSSGRIDPVRAVFGVGWLGVVRPCPGGPGPDSRFPDRLLLGRRRLRRGPGDHRRRPAGRPRAGPGRGPVGLSAGRRSDRRAGRAGAHPRSRRHGRSPPRLGASDPRADPEERRGRPPGGAAGPGPGARPARLVVRRPAG